ncbi:hypothetical protein INT45_003235 [Circinella minor]|uniref:Uncharacterized protein n=1 Tax=Circinella minor TaxID=1195481 RepID=A0A8H7VLI2_9FUNG|nr:hypothetical protein INT45_003235 [Circinella minor]
MPRPTNPENVYKGMSAFKLNETSEQSSTILSNNVENGEDCLSTTVSTNDNSSSVSENNILSWSSETVRQFLAIIKANYMSIEQDDGVATWTRFTEKLKQAVQNNNQGNRVGTDDVKAFLEKMTAKEVHRQWNLMVDTYLQIKQHVGIVGVGDSRGQRVWEFYDEIDKITRDDSSINPRVIIESMDRGATGAHFYYNRDSPPIDDNSKETAEEEEGEEEEARDGEEERDYEWNTRFWEFSRAESSRFFQKFRTVLEEDRKRRTEDYATFERNIRQRQEEYRLERMSYREEERRSRNKRHEEHLSIMRRLLAITERHVEQYKLDPSTNINNINNNNNNNNNSDRDE